MVIVDSGKFATKALTRGSNGELSSLYFETNIRESDEVATTLAETYAMSVAGESYLIGKFAKETKNFSRTKAEKPHKLSMLLAVHQLVEDNSDVVVFVGCPLNDYDYKKQRENYEEFMRGDGEYEVTVQGRTKKFNIVSVTALPETSGFIAKNAEKLEDKVVGLVDIGGLNANCALYQELNPVSSKSFAENKGVNILLRDLKFELEGRYGVLVDDRLMFKAVVEGIPFKIKNVESSDILQFIDSFKELHVRSILEDLNRQGWSTNTLDFVFSGGGSIILKEQIKKVFGDDVLISSDGVWDNVEGFALIAGL